MFSLSTPKRCSLIWNDTDGLLTCGSSSHVSVGHPSSPSSSSSVLVIGAIFWPEVGHPLLVWGSVDRWPGRVGHLGDGTLWAVQSSRWKPGGTGHGKLLRSKREKENTWLRHDVFFLFFASWMQISAAQYWLCSPQYQIRQYADYWIMKCCF